MRLQTFLEKKGEKAHREAIAMGLQYKGFGYWADPQTGEAKYKTVNDSLVPVEPDVESDLYKGNEKEEDPAAAGAPQGQMAVPGGAAAGAMQQMIGQGISQGTPEGMMAAPQKNTGWEAGPDGDTCVDGEKPEIAKDVFVGKTNFSQWTAGPDGSNAMELGEMRELIGEAEFNKDRRQHIQNVKNFAAGNNSNPGTETRNDVMLAQGKGASWLKSYLGRVAKNAGITSPSSDSNRGRGLARNAQWTGKSKGEPLIPDTDSKGTVPKTTQYSTYDYDDDEPKRPSWIDDGAPEVRRADRRLVDKMNESAREMVQDADFDLDQYDDRDPIASGVFGSFTLGDDGVGVKTGNIGPGELAALFAMRDNPHFPTLINARFDGPFINQSSAYNNPENNPDMHRRSDGNYFDPKTAQSWNKRFPGAWGKYAMSVAGGEQLNNVWNELTPEIKQKAMKSLWEARGELHKAGFSHNDMHGGNIMVDPETGEVSILDLGLAEDNPTSALMEALGGLDFEEGQDYQLSHHVSGANLPQEIMDRITDRRMEFEESLKSTFEGDLDKNARQTLESLMHGNIRMDKEEMDKILSVFPKLGDGEFVKEKLAALYDGLWDTEYPEDAAREEPKPGGLIGNRSRVDSIINRMRGNGQIGTGQSGLIRKAMNIDD